MKALLLSNSTNFGEAYLSWCKNIIKEFLAGHGDDLLFVPYAAVGFSYQTYTDKVNQALAPLNIQVRGLHEFDNKTEALTNSSGILVGGGNTFHLLRELQTGNLLDVIRTRAIDHIPYVGWSAGSNIAGKTIRTTNDMPIVEPESFHALNLISSQINPHYTEKTIPNHGGETRMQRLLEFTAANSDEEVICLPEASYLIAENSQFKYVGNVPGILLRGNEQHELMPGEVLKF